MLARLAFVAATMLWTCTNCLVGAEITAEKTEQGVTVSVDGKLFTRYLTQSGDKPVMWPLIGPGEQELTRGYPLRDATPEEKQDHIHHRSFWFTHGSVNGVDFWSENPNHGKIVHREFVEVTSGKEAVIATRNDWIGPDGKKVCEDLRRFRFAADHEARWIDCEIELFANPGEVVFGDTKEGSFAIRVAESIKVDAKKGGRIVNSEGQVDGAAWGQPAAWVDYHGPVGDQVCGIAILNHPSSFRFPTPWHVRTYGLFAANPFGLHDFAGGKADVNGSHKLPAGEKMLLRYRVLLHAGDHQAGKVATHFEQYRQLQ